jgi:hypothetical protein
MTLPPGESRSACRFRGPKDSSGTQRFHDTLTHGVEIPVTLADARRRWSLTASITGGNGNRSRAADRFHPPGVSRLACSGKRLTPWPSSSLANAVSASTPSK